MVWNRTTVQFLDGNGIEKGAIFYSDGTNFAAAQSFLDSTGSIVNPATSDLQTTGNTSLASIATTVALLSTSSLQTAGNTILSSIFTELAGGIQVSGNITVVASALPAGAATSALQTTGNSSLATIVTNTGNGATAANQATANTSLASIATNTAAGATAAGQTTAQTSLSAIATAVAAATPAGTNLIGKVGIDQTTPGTTNGIVVTTALPAGTNLLGKTGIDQTTPGTTNGVVVNAALPAGTNTIGGVNAVANTSGGTSVYCAAGAPANALILATPIAVKASPGNLYGVNFVNPNNVDIFVSFYDVASGGVNVGTTAPKLVIQVPANGGWEEKFTGEAKITFATAITMAAATAVNVATPPAVGLLGNIVYK